MAGAGFHSIAKLRAPIPNLIMADHGVFSTDCLDENGRKADCQGQESKLESGLPQACTVRRVRIRPERGSWQSAIHLRADCQAVILVVENCGIGAW
jgi:hypothetical protein